MFRTLRRVVWPPVDPALVDAGREGELAVARTRIAIVGLLALNPAAAFVRQPDDAAALLTLVIELFFLALSITVLQLARRHPPVAGLGFAAAALDVSVVSFYHVTVFAGAFAPLAFSSRVAFALYLLAILATSLRNDGRVATFAGLLAAAQWTALIRFFDDTAVDTMAAFEELVIIAAATMLARIIASRARGLRLSSIRDNLTGLLNRAHFEERLATELIRSTRTHRPLALAIIDVDQFKRVNDTFGHLAGDEVLREVAARLTKTVRRSDLCCRFGGDEFALAFIDTSVVDAAARLEDLRRTVSATPIPLRIQGLVTITCSAGVAVSPLDGEDATTLLGIADARLLAAKSAGRDRLMVAG
ncbi:MAG TPA: GGDEF domain-containing protein [Vicinamibacterales bacterium]|nr:GGDEF domain-containing protein [Vicinamibacterales bacterium]